MDGRAHLRQRLLYLRPQMFRIQYAGPHVSGDGKSGFGRA